MIYSKISEETMFDGALVITPEQIKETMELFRSIDMSLLEADIKNAKASAEKDMNKYLTKPSITLIGKDIKKYSTLVSRVIETKGLNSNSIREINTLMYDAFNAFAHDMDVNDSVMLKFKGYDANKIRKAIMLDIYVLCINTILINIFQFLFGFAGYMIGAVVIAPIVEESAKRISVVGGYATEFAIVFNAGEFALYVTEYQNVSAVVAIRLVCVGVHLINFVINWFTNNTKLLERLNVKKEDNPEQVSNMGYLLGIAIHSIWNAGFGNIVLRTLGLLD